MAYLVFCVAVVLLIAAGIGLKTGVLPAKWIDVSQASSPALFWFALVSYAGFAAVLVYWGILEVQR